jgi:hypothetical protein
MSSYTTHIKTSKGIRPDFHPLFLPDDTRSRPTKMDGNILSDEGKEGDNG